MMRDRPPWPAHRWPSALRAVASILLIAGAGAAGSIAAVDPRIDLASPRATFDTFLTAMNDVRAGEKERIRDAAACLDLSRVPGLARDETGAESARQLKTYLDKLELIDLAAIPDEAEAGTWVYRMQPEGEVSLARTKDGVWLFSPQTVAALPALVASVADREFVAGLTGGGRASAFAQWVRRQVPAPLRQSAFLLEIWQWIALLVMALAGVIVDRATRFVFTLWWRRVLSRSGLPVDRKVLSDFATPLGIAAMSLLWHLVLPQLGLPASALAALKFAATLLLAAAGVWAAYRLVDLLSVYIAQLASKTDTKFDDLLVPLFRRALKILVVAFGIVFVAQNMDIKVTSLLAGLGIGGIALAMAAKDTVENLFGSVTVLIDRPFEIGDWIVVGDVEGTVEELGFRSTRVRTFHNSLITLPNSLLVKASVDNLGARRYRRLKTMVSVQYDTPPGKIDAFCEGIRELIRNHPYTRKDFYLVYFNQFAASSLDILLYAFHETPDWPTELRERHRLLVDIVRLAERLGVQFAFPTQTLHLASVPPALAALAARAPRESEATPADPREPADVTRLGREEAERLLRDYAGREPQPPVDFGETDLLMPG